MTGDLCIMLCYRDTDECWLVYVYSMCVMVNRTMLKHLLHHVRGRMRHVCRVSCEFVLRQPLPNPEIVINKNRYHITYLYVIAYVQDTLSQLLCQH